MTGSAPMSMSGGASMMLLSGINYPHESHLSIITPARVCFATERPKLRSNCNGSVSRRKQPKHARGLKQRRFPSKGLTTTDPDLECLRVKRGLVIFASGVEDEGPSLNRNDVLELVSVAVHMLLKPENQNRLRERLEKTKQALAKAPERPSNVDQWSSPEPTNSLQNLGEVRHSEIEADDAIDSGGCPSAQLSLTSKNVTVPIPSQMTELVESEGQSQSIETMESSTGSVEGKDDNSLTSIRRLKVLDVHSYVHNALRESALRSWLRSRTIEE